MKNEITYINYQTRPQDSFGLRNACSDLERAIKDGWREFQEPDSDDGLALNIIVKNGTHYYDFFPSTDGEDWGTLMYENLYKDYAKNLSFKDFKNACEHSVSVFEWYQDENGAMVDFDGVLIPQEV